MKFVLTSLMALFWNFQLMLCNFLLYENIRIDLDDDNDVDDDDDGGDDDDDELFCGMLDRPRAFSLTLTGPIFRDPHHREEEILRHFASWI